MSKRERLSPKLSAGSVKPIERPMVKLVSSDPYSEAKQFLHQFGVTDEDFNRMPEQLALKVLEVTLVLAQVKEQADAQGVPVGFTVGPVSWYEDVYDPTIEGPSTC